MPNTLKEPNPIIIVGASLVGLTAAVGLATRDVPTIVLERHAGVSDHPRSIGLTPRTMEIFDALNIAHQIPQVNENYAILRARVESLASGWSEITSWSDNNNEEAATQPSNQPKREYSAFRAAAVPQDRVERILEAAALERGVDIRRGHTVKQVQQDATGVVITAVDSSNAAEVTLRGSYLVAADGSHSGIRQQLGICRGGRGAMGILRTVLFRCSALDQYTQTGVHQFDIQRPEFKAFLTTYHDGRWVLMFYDDIERDETTLRASINKIIGPTDTKVDIITTGRWELAALVASTFQSGRIFLAGDAAHTLPPNRGGFGANTGIADADNLAWKLAAVVSGASSPGLLDTYDAERRPVALLRHDQLFARPDFKSYCNETTRVVTRLDDASIEFGQLYHSKCFLGAADGEPTAMRPEMCNGQPGSHIPHIWVWMNSKRESLCSCLGGGWGLISQSDDWEPVVAAVNRVSTIRVQHVKVEAAALLDGDSLQEKLGIDYGGASLIRPDGYIAWRTTGMPCEAAGVLHHALSQVGFASTKHS